MLGCYRHRGFDSEVCVSRGDVGLSLVSFHRVMRFAVIKEDSWGGDHRTSWAEELGTVCREKRQELRKGAEVAEDKGHQSK